MPYFRLIIVRNKGAPRMWLLHCGPLAIGVKIASVRNYILATLQFGENLILFIPFCCSIRSISCLNIPFKCILYAICMGRSRVTNLQITFQIAKTLRSTSVRYQSYANVSDCYLIDFDLRVFVCRWLPWSSCQIGKIVGCACAGNAGNVFPSTDFKRKTLVSDPNMHHGTCVTHVPWCMSGSLTTVAGKTFTAFPGHAQPAILRIWQEAHGDETRLHLRNMVVQNVIKLK